MNEQEKEIKNQNGFDGVHELPGSATLFQARKGEKYGIYSSSRKALVVPVEFDAVNLQVDKDRVSVEKAGKHGMYSISHEKIVVPIEWDFVSTSPNPTNTDTYEVVNGKKHGVYSRLESKLIMPIEYDTIIELVGSDHFKDSPYNGQYRVQLEEKIGRFDPKTQSVTWN
ncbi:MAG: hypothetical protein JWO73_89 [Candidatus Taylorbacteria bacterium]|nr:hypothetical protein [Candidatus Taylorbacteria bacterium]